MLFLGNRDEPKISFKCFFFYNLYQLIIIVIIILPLCTCSLCKDDFANFRALFDVSCCFEKSHVKLTVRTVYSWQVLVICTQFNTRQCVLLNCIHRGVKHLSMVSLFFLHPHIKAKSVYFFLTFVIMLAFIAFDQKKKKQKTKKTHDTRDESAWTALNCIIPVKWNVICRKMQENRSRFPKSHIWICIASWLCYHYTVIASCTYNCNSNSCMTERMVYVNRLLNYSCYGCPSKAKFPAVCYFFFCHRLCVFVSACGVVQAQKRVCVRARGIAWLTNACVPVVKLLSSAQDSHLGLTSRNRVWQAVAKTIITNTQTACIKARWLE